MPEDDRSRNAEPASPADRTLLGVAPPRLESSPEPALRSPVFVRSGTSVADVEPPPLPRMALPLRPGAGASEPPPSLSAPLPPELVRASPGPLERGLVLARTYPALGMVLAPALLAVLVIAAAALLSPKPVKKVAVTPSAPTSPSRPAAEPVSVAAPPLPPLSELEAKPPETLSASELLRLAGAKAERRVAAAKALCEKVEQTPALAADKATQAELLRLARDSETSREALGALASLSSPVGPDLLYEVWTGTPGHSEATELARALAYTPDVRARASAALSVALELRAAQSCEAFAQVLPRALKDGDRRSLPPLAKLTVKRGCGPRKSEDCFACLRAEPDELAATMNAVKSRRAPAYLGQ